MSRTPGFQLYVAIPRQKTVITLTADANGLFRDVQGTIWAMRDRSTDTDPSDVCGVFPVAVPNWPIFRELNAVCAPHDFAYSSPEYQWFHTRAEADAYLQSLVEQVPFWGFLAKPFRWVAEKIGRPFWEGRR